MEKITVTVKKEIKLRNELTIRFDTKKENFSYNAGYYRGILKNDHMLIDAIEHCVDEYEKFIQKYGKNTAMWIEFTKEEFGDKYATVAFAVMYHLNYIGYNVGWSAVVRDRVPLRINKSEGV